jgi:hypothetical protein
MIVFQNSSFSLRQHPAGGWKAWEKGHFQKSPAAIFSSGW